MNKIRVMLVDDQMLLREGLKTIINLQDDMEVVFEAENGKLAFEYMEEKKIDVILMDIRMPVLNGVEASRIIKNEYSDVSIIILTTFDDDDYVIEALSNGADGYLLKDIDSIHLTQSIRDAYNGQIMLNGKVASKLANFISGKKSLNKSSENINLDNGDHFSNREKEIALLMAEVHSNRQIAKALFLSEGTVKNYISEIYCKLGTNNRTKAIILIKQMFEE